MPRDRKVCLILDALDFPASLHATAESAIPNWGIQLFGGAAVFGDPERARLFREAVEAIRRRALRGLLEPADGPNLHPPHLIL